MGKFKGIILHWDVSRYYQYFKADYHFIINPDGDIIEGVYKPEDNLNCTDGKYAAHCGGGNTGRIGICLNGMYGYVDNNSVGEYPITLEQIEATCKLTAELCKKYNISINNVLTHAEFGKKYPNTSSNGKIDICWLPNGVKGIKEVGDNLRNKIKWYYNRLYK